ncbi:MAG: DUF1080 domain-containing protein [Akkermansiaceae bacterium]|nr:DUF1080 domain-containing protein [Akkermansiaceae bacterium]
MKRLALSHPVFFPACLAVALLVPPSARAQDEAPAIAPKETVNLLADRELKDFTHHLNPKSSVSLDRDEVWIVGEDGVLQVTGKGFGYLRTNRKYRDYHLVLEYKWGERTWGNRLDRARDCGLLVHGYGKDGAFGDTWINSIEAQLIEGGSGDILVLAYQERGGEKAPTSLTAEVKNDRDGEAVWTPGGESRVFPPAEKTNARINWRDRDPDWADVKGYRGSKDIENPLGEWNRMEVICKGDTIEIRINGELVNSGTKANPTEGYICLQSEAAECWIRRYELWPIGAFKEEWKPAVASTDTGYSAGGESILPRRLPLSPEESQAAWEIDGDYEMQLAAAEPVVCDPVDVVWDEKGRMFVAEMGDYPEPAPGGGNLSRIRLLRDKDGDGRMDEAVTWAAELDHVQGLLPMNGGLLATTRTAILFLQDTDGDDKADKIETVFQQNEPRHNQLQVSAPRWGLDNAIYLNNGLDLKEIYPGEHPEQKLAVTKANLRLDPRTRTLTPVTGFGQFGGTQDDYGRRFCCSNRNPVMFAVMPLGAAGRNPFQNLAMTHEDIQPPGAPVWPINLSHTTSAAHAGTHTAACGIGVYRGGLMSDLRGNILVCEPTAQLVTRNRLVPNGASLTAERVGEKRDFLVSNDEWTRPVNLRNGPDGALYICDMYRRFIDHARFFPEEFSKTNFMRAGFDQGRVWRLVPKGTKPQKIEPLPESGADLVALLASENSWRRLHAQRLIIERRDQSTAPALAKLLAESASPQARVHALWTLHGLGSLTAAQAAAALKDTEPGVVENATALAAEFFADAPEIKSAWLDLLKTGGPRVQMLVAVEALAGDDRAEVTDAMAAALRKSPTDLWLLRGIVSASEKRSASLLAAMLGDAAVISSEDAEAKATVLRELAQTVGASASADLPGLATVLGTVKGAPDWWHFAVVDGLGEGLRRGKLARKSVAALLAKPPAELDGKLGGLQAVLDSAQDILLDRSKPAAERLAALPLVQQQGMEPFLALAEKLIDGAEAADVQAAACKALARFDRDKVSDFFFERWKTLGPTPRREALELIAANPATGLRLMQKMKAGEINKALMPPMQKWSYARSTNEEIKALAIELFGKPSEDRAAIIADYKSAIAGHEGDAGNGKLVFEKAACVTCHKIGDTGAEVGPNITDVRIKPPEALLSDILDPNRAVEERWTAWTVETKDGRTLAGLIAAETPNAIELRLPGGLAETIARDQIAKMETTGLSLMPVGLDAAITKPEMADLIAFLKAR